LPMQIIIAAALQIFAPQHHPCTRAAALTVQMPAHCLRITAQSTADDLTSLLCSLLCYTLTSLLCTSCSLLRSGTLEQPFLLGKRVCDRIPLRHHVRRRALFASYDLRASRPPTTSAACSSSPTTPPIAFGNCLRHLRVVHLPRHDYRARFRVRVPRLAPRAPCLLRPARQQTIYNVSGLLLPLSTTSFTMFGVCPVGSRALPRPHLGEARAGGCTRRAYESNPHIRPQASHLPIYACRTLTGVKLDFLLLRV
jgi:hypothetical protein